MFKRKGMRKRIIAIALAIAMIVTLMPELELVASGVTVRGYPIYNDVIFDAIKADKITNTSYTSKNTVYGGITPRFHEKSRYGMTHIYENLYFTSSLLSLSPAMMVISTDDSAWKAEFEANLDWLYGITDNPDVFLRFGSTLKSTKSKPSMTVGNVTIGGSSLSKKSTTAVEGTLKAPIDDSVTITVQGASGTEARGMWVAAIDNSPAEYEGISASVSGSSLYLYVKMDEQLRWANTKADQYKDQMYAEFYLRNSLTNIESACLRANFESIDGDTIKFCCSSIGSDFANGEFQITRITKVNIPVISGIDFAVYGIGACYDYYSSYDYSRRQPIYTKIGNPITYMQDVKLNTTPITDLAGNKVDLGPMNLEKENLSFDKMNPTVQVIRVEDASGKNREAAGNINEDESKWPEDIKREQIFLGNNQGLKFSAVISEGLDKSKITLKGPNNSANVTAKLNVLDADGKQVVLQATGMSEEAPGTFGERTKAVLQFETFTAATGMKMMSGYEGKPIQIVGLTGTLRDKAGNNLSGTVPAAEKRIFLDTTAPTVTVEKSTAGADKREIEFLVTVTDKQQDLSAGVLGQYATLELIAEELSGIKSTYNYTYKVLSTGNDTLASGTGSMSTEKAGTISWKLHAHDSYAAKVQIHVTNSEKILVDGIKTKVSVKDIVGNNYAGTQEAYEYFVDEVAPSISLEPVKYTYGSNKADITVTFSAQDYSDVYAKYQWTEIGAENPAEDKWQAIELSENGEGSVTEAGLETSVEKKFWVCVKDNEGNKSVKSTDVKLTIVSPNIYYDTTAITSEPDAAPQLIVKGAEPLRGDAGLTDANTRVTVKMGDKSYVRIVKTGDTVNVFDFSDVAVWYEVTFNEAKDSYTSVSTVTDMSALRNYYGAVTVSFDAAYADLTPAEGSVTKNVTNSSYIKDDAEIKVLYASPTVKSDPKEVHKVTFGKVNNAAGTELAGDASVGKDAVLFQQIAGEASVLAGTQISFSLSNLLISDWGIRNIDFSKSYVELVYTKGDTSTVLDTVLLQNTKNQTYILPASLNYETGMYSIKVYVYQTGSEKAATYQSLNLVLDAQTVQNAGLWEYKITPDGFWTQREIVHKGDTEPLEMVGITLTEEKQIERNDVFAYYTAGASWVAMSLQCSENAETYDGIEVGKVAGFRVWNSLSNLTEADLENYAFTRAGENEDGRAKLNYYALLPEVHTEETFPQGNEGFITEDTRLPVVKGINTFYYQVKLANGTVSEVRQFTFVVSDITPNLNVKVDGYTESLKSSFVEDQILVSDIKMKIEDAYSMNGSGDVLVTVQAAGNADITHSDGTKDVYNESTSFNSEGYPLAVGDVVLFDDNNNNSWSIDGPFEEEPDTRLAFIVFDDFGGSMIIAPQLGNEGNKYSIDDTEWKIQPYNYSSSDDKGAYVESHLSFRNDFPYSSEDILPELVDYDSISFTFTTDEGEAFTYPMVENYAEPNPAGYMGAKRDPYSGEFTVYIANPVEKDPSENWMSYQVNYKDINGNEYVMGAGYGPEKVSSGVKTEDTTDAGVNLRMYAAVAGGIDAQFKTYDNSHGDGYIKTGRFANGLYEASYVDMFGTTHDISYEIQYGWDFGVDVSYSTQESTLNDVTVSITSTENVPITVAEIEGITIKSNGTTAVEVTASKNVTFEFTMENSEEVRTLEVNNIVEFNPQIQWSYDESQILTDEKGVKYLYGPVTAYIIDEELDVWDAYTGAVPSYTFYPGEAASYTFKGSDYFAMLGEETVNGVDITVKLPVELRNEILEVENPDIPTEDTEVPTVQLRAYAKRNGLFENENLALQVEPGIYRDVLTDYEGDTIIECFDKRADTTEFLKQIGWASVYRFQIELVDDSDVKLFIKDGLYASAPSYSSGKSDTIAGVSLSGRVLEITDTAEFTLFAVDEKGNVTTIPFDVTNVGEAPVPQVKVRYAGTSAYVYVLPPEVENESEVSNFKLTGPQGVKIETDSNSEFYGKWYMTYTKNNTAANPYLINYSYTYKGETIIGVLEVVVDEIDDVQIYSENIKWSANKSKEATNQDVTVQITFNKNVKEILVPYGFEDKVNVLVTGNRVIVRYAENLAEELFLTAIANNDTDITIPLDAVTNIDKAAPVVSTPEVVLAENGKSVTVTFVTDEDALFSEENRYGTKKENGYVHTGKITKNGAYTYSFIDKAGNIQKVTFTVDQIVDTNLELWFNTSASNTGASKEADSFALKVGESIYVKANRACTITLNNGSPKEVSANTWQAIVITENEAGLWPIIYAVDAYGNTNSALLGGVKPLDKEAPVITVAKECIFAKAGTKRADILEVLQANITVKDADTKVEVTIDFTENVNTEGTTAVTYTAKDSSGNVATKTGWLKLTSSGEPEVKVNGKQAGRDSVYLASLSETLELTVDTYGEPYTVMYEKGVYTAAQMKIGANVLLRDAEKVIKTKLPFTEAGYYTVCVRTQSRDEYVFIVYVE